MIIYDQVGTDALDTESSLVLAGVMRHEKAYRERKSFLPTISAGFDDPFSSVVEGSEPEYRSYEAVCPVTNLVRNRWLDECPLCFGECGESKKERIA